jgi:IstB-like ATP binding protein
LTTVLDATPARVLLLLVGTLAATLVVRLRAQLNDRIKSIFGGTSLEVVPFLGRPWDVPDEIGNGPCCRRTASPPVTLRCAAHSLSSLGWAERLLGLTWLGARVWLWKVELQKLPTTSTP